ncbi:MAG: hypothetical protein NTW21_41970 [Verrucomicrobia bacterium]|nr:hypothetical protein [Verrucomicrobiota bacterium]
MKPLPTIIGLGLCGSVVEHEGVSYNFYCANDGGNADGSDRTGKPNWRQSMNLATSKDGIHFEKYSAGNPLIEPTPGKYYNWHEKVAPFPHHARDMVDCRDMLVLKDPNCYGQEGNKLSWPVKLVPRTDQGLVPKYWAGCDMIFVAKPVTLQQVELAAADQPARHSLAKELPEGFGAYMMQAKIQADKPGGFALSAQGKAVFTNVDFRPGADEAMSKQPPVNQ